MKHAADQKDYFDAETHILSGCGHWPMIDDPETVSSLVLPFLCKQLARETDAPG